MVLIQKQKAFILSCIFFIYNLNTAATYNIKNFFETSIPVPPIPQSSLPLNATRVPGITADGLCNIVVGTDFTDPEKYLITEPIFVELDQQCCLLCQQVEGCMSWTYYNNDDSASGKVEGSCYLSSDATDGVRCNFCSSTSFKKKSDTLHVVLENVAFDTEYGLLNDPTTTLVSSTDECYKSCYNEPRCIAWTFVKKTMSKIGIKEGMCYLREFAPNFIGTFAADSGVSLEMKMQMCQPQVDTCLISVYGYMNGPDYPITSSNEECAYLCQTTLGCRSWVRVKVTYEKYKEGQCVLRDWVPESEPCPYADSGLDVGLGATENVILIIADDLGIDHLKIYKEFVGDKTRDTYPYTPSLDDLMKNGIIFDNAYSNPTCSPSRSAMITGQHCFRTGVGYPIGSICEVGLDGSFTTLPKLLPSFVASAAIGKWHISSFGANLDIPRQMGFNRFEGFIDGTIFNYTSWAKTINGDPVVETYTYCTTDMVNAVQKFFDSTEIEKFFLWMAFNAPHTPFHLPPLGIHYHENLPPHGTDPNYTDTQYFHAMIEALDTEIGRIWDYIPKEKQERTTTIFIGDNGSPCEVSDGHPFTEHQCKETLTEGGIRVPFVISGAGVKYKGRRIQDLVHTIDLFATIIELFGGQIPDDHITDSISIVPIMKNETYLPRSFVYSEAFGPGKSCDNPSRGFIFDYGQVIRNQRYKLHIPFYYDDEGEQIGIAQMYDLIEDPWETYNLLDDDGIIKKDLDYLYQLDILNNKNVLGVMLKNMNDQKVTRDASLVELSGSSKTDFDIWLEREELIPDVEEKPNIKT